MARLKHALVSARPPDAPVHHKVSRPIKPIPYAKLAEVGVSAIKKRRSHGVTRPGPIVWMDVDPARYADNLERPALNVDGPGAPTGTVVASLVSEAPAAARQEPTVRTDVDPVPRAHKRPASTIDRHRPVSSRKRKAHEESSVIPPVAYPKTKEAKMDIPFSSTESSPISSRKARARDELVDVPPTNLRKRQRQGTRRFSQVCQCYPFRQLGNS